LRARFLAEHGWGEETAIFAELERRDALLARARALVLWFEHDLFDQLQLLQVVAQLDDAAEVELVQADDYLGAYDADRLEALWDARQPVEAPARALARDAWRAVCENDLDSALARDLSVFPHLGAALRRLREERAPLPRTKRQLLEALVDGAKTPLELFLANQAREEAIFLGDTWCFLFVWELARDGLVRPTAPVPLPLPPPRGDYDAFVATTVELTPAGRELV